MPSFYSYSSGRAVRAVGSYRGDTFADRRINCRPAGYEAAAGSFIHGIATWTTWATLTFGRPVSDSQADAALVRWLRAVAKQAAREHLRVVWGVEYQPGGYPHFHVLLAFPPTVAHAAVQHRRLAQLWRQSDKATGFSHFRRFDPDQGAAWYVAVHAEWDVQLVCPRRPRCRRKAGCRLTTLAL
jgi:hypothetical protein